MSISGQRKRPREATSPKFVHRTDSESSDFSSDSLGRMESPLPNISPKSSDAFESVTSIKKQKNTEPNCLEKTQPEKIPSPPSSPERKKSRVIDQLVEDDVRDYYEDSHKPESPVSSDQAACESDKTSDVESVVNDVDDDPKYEVEKAAASSVLEQEDVILPQWIEKARAGQKEQLNNDVDMLAKTKGESKSETLEPMGWKRMAKHLDQLRRSRSHDYSHLHNLPPPQSNEVRSFELCQIIQIISISLSLNEVSISQSISRSISSFSWSGSSKTF